MSIEHICGHKPKNLEPQILPEPSVPEAAARPPLPVEKSFLSPGDHAMTPSEVE